MNKNQHVTKRPDGCWQVIGAGNERPSRIVPTQKETIAIARRIAINQKSDVVIHRENGEFRDRNSYGNDPYPPKG